jgi:ketosteroid isomerase-like protein
VVPNTGGVDAAVVTAFNEAINRRDLAALAQLMTLGHRFIDAAGGTVVGRDACIAAWRGFFESFPDYRNIFDAVVDAGGGTVEARGRSECCVPELHGPAQWRAEVIDGRVDVWHVTDAEAGS